MAQEVIEYQSGTLIRIRTTIYTKRCSFHDFQVLNLLSRSAIFLEVSIIVLVQEAADRSKFSYAFPGSRMTERDRCMHYDKNLSVRTLHGIVHSLDAGGCGQLRSVVRG